MTRYERRNLGSLYLNENQERVLYRGKILYTTRGSGFGRKSNNRIFEEVPSRLYNEGDSFKGLKGT